MPQATAQQQQASLVSQHTRFKASTNRQRLPLQDLTFTAANQFQRADVAQVGFLSRIYIWVGGSLTFGAGATGTVTQYFPWNILSSIAFRSNEGQEIYRTNGFTNLLVQRTLQNSLYDPAVQWRPSITNVNRFYQSANTGPLAISGAVGLTPGTTIPTSGTINISAFYVIPITVDDALSAGLLLLQNQSTRAQVELQLGQLTDWFGASATLGAGTFNSFTAKISMELYRLPASPADYPDLTYINRTISETDSWTATGDQVKRITPGNIVYRVLREYRQAATPAPQAFFAADNPNSPNFSNVFVSYGGTQRPEFEDVRIFLARQQMQYAWHLPDGTFCHEFGEGNGALGNFDARDAYDTAGLTEFFVAETYTGGAPTNGTIITTRHELQPVVL